MFTRPTLHTRDDGSKYLLDVKELELQLGKATEAVNKYNQIATLLSEYEDTRDRAKSPEYFFGGKQPVSYVIET